MDNVAVRTALDLEKKYNLSKLAGQVTNIETNTQDIIHIQKELEDTKNAIIINLGDTLEDSVSLWFYEGTPTLSNEPYTDWVTPADHYGDLYYDQLTGQVFKYTSNGWEQQTDTKLINALALTNADIDVREDHERKVYLTQPSPPYSSGDWWIQEDGTLQICQLGKETGDYEENDFIVSTMYTSNIATKDNDTIQVISGQVTTIINNNAYIQQNVAELQELVDTNGNSIGTLSNQVTTLQSATSLQINAINTQLENGVEKLKNSLVTINANGINTSKTGETFNTQITNKTFEVKDGTTRMGFMGFDTTKQKMLVEFPEMTTRRLTFANHTTESITEDGENWSAFFYNGGGS